MKKVIQTRLKARRFLMQNPYAHVEQLLDGGDVSEIRRSRMILQNQYAHLDGDGSFSAVSVNGSTNGKRLSQREIEEFARKVHKMLWKGRDKSNSELSPIDLLNPQAAAKHLGFDLEYVDSLGLYTDRSGKVVVSGLIDRPSRSIQVSRELEPRVQRFTAAHEIGHAILHEHMSLVHRDRPMDGTRIERDQLEYEADKFATYFLMPKNLLRTEFEARFLMSPFILDETTSFALANGSLTDAIKTYAGQRGRRKLARLLAAVTQYNGKHFYSLSECFRVSVDTMAIRLEELNLV